MLVRYSGRGVGVKSGLIVSSESHTRRGQALPDYISLSFVPSPLLRAIFIFHFYARPGNINFSPGNISPEIYCLRVFRFIAFPRTVFHRFDWDSTCCKNRSARESRIHSSLSRLSAHRRIEFRESTRKRSLE